MHITLQLKNLLVKFEHKQNLENSTQKKGAFSSLKLPNVTFYLELPFSGCIEQNPNTLLPAFLLLPFLNAIPDAEFLVFVGVE